MKNLEQMDFSELKILHYDVLRLVERGQILLRAINEQIMKKENEQANTLNAKQSPDSEVKEDNSKEKK